MSHEINRDRRHFISPAAATVAGAQFAGLGLAEGQFTKTASALPSVKAGTNTSFGPLKTINAGPLSVGYAEAGPSEGPAVLLLHGWPYDIHSFVEVAPILTSAGYRVIIPYARGYGSTRF